MFPETQRLKTRVSLHKIKRVLVLPLTDSDNDKFIDSVSSFGNDVESCCLLFSSHAVLHKTSGIVFAPKGSVPADNVIIVADPKHTFFKILSWLYKNIGFDDLFASNISKKAEIDDTAKISRSVTISDGCLIGPGVVIYPNVYLGKNCVVEANSVIGSAGFGVMRNSDATAMVPHIGGVQIHDNVRIGALCTIDRATMGLTNIGCYTKVDDKVHVAHNCQIGSRNIICAGANLGGSVIIEDDVWIGLGCSIRQKIKIHSNAVIGIGANVFHDVKPGVEIFGYPSKVTPKTSGLSERLN